MHKVNETNRSLSLLATLGLSILILSNLANIRDTFAGPDSQTAVGATPNTVVVQQSDPMQTESSAG